MLKRMVLFMLALGLAASAYSAGSIVVVMRLASDKGLSNSIGTITASESRYGVVFTPALRDLPPGVHGFHMHTYPDCQPKLQDGRPVPALAAGGHFDPANTGKHEGPWGEGHLGDLPALYVGADGLSTQPVLAPRLKLSDLPGHALMIHVGGDNHADKPQALGGGGARLACGVIGEVGKH